jgi:restriction endonuclease S subunit
VAINSKAAWDEELLDNVAVYRRGSFPQPYGLAKWYDDVSGFPFIQVVDVTDNGKIKDEPKRLISEAAKQLSVFVPSNSVILTIQGSIGRVAITHYDSCVDRTLLIFERFKKPFDKRYFRYAIQVLFELEAQSAPGGIIKTITKEALSKFPLPVPPLAEQEAIANALSDADAYIESLEKLIAKKRLIKKGLMQELLTGKRRLPGFGRSSKLRETELGWIPDDWQVKYLPEVCRFRSGKAHEQYISEDGKYVCVNSKFISTDGQVRKYSSANFCPANLNDILMVMSDLPNGKALAKVFMADRDNYYAVNQRVCALTAFKDDPEFLGLQLNRNPYFIKFDDGVSQTHLLNRVFEKCPIVLPSLVEEQRAISDCLSDLSLEILKLEEVHSKARHLKQGMMQELLTGRIRLI